MLINQIYQQVVTTGIDGECLLFVAFRAKFIEDAADPRFVSHLWNNFRKKSENFMATSRLLESVSYKKVLSRGYSVIRDEDEKIVSTKSQLKSKSALTIEWADGKVRVREDK